MDKKSAHAAKIETSRVVFSGRIFNVAVDRVRLPHSVTVDMEVVRHPASVILLPIDSDGRLILVRQYRYAVDRWLWELPAGSVDPGETPEAAAVRECAEEIRLKPGALDLLGSFYPSPGYCDELMIFFRLMDLRGLGPDDEEAQVDADEDLEVRHFPLDEIHTLIERGEIRDMKTIVGLRYCKVP
ncbi:MAG TPA: NUDIX hydrolase [Vicinamibacterales bacterium]|jgi:ADP-ribose pyrophosphatase